MDDPLIDSPRVQDRTAESTPRFFLLPDGRALALAQPLARRTFVHASMLTGLAGLAFAAGCANQSTGYPDPIEPGTNVPIRPAQQVGTTPPPVAPRVVAQPQRAPSVPSGVIRRSSWTRSGVARPNQIYALGRVNKITVHHEGVTPFTTTSEDATRQRLEIIRRGHVAAREWADIGYHYVIDPAGRIWEGRNIQYQGAHVKDQNENNLGIMCLGNFERQQPSSAQVNSLDRFLAIQMRQYRVPVSRLYTHRELAPTECPGRNLQRYMVMARAQGGSLRFALSELGRGDLSIA